MPPAGGTGGLLLGQGDADHPGAGAGRVVRVPVVSRGFRQLASDRARHGVDAAGEARAACGRESGDARRPLAFGLAECDGIRDGRVAARNGAAFVAPRAGDRQAEGACGRVEGDLHVPRRPRAEVVAQVAVEAFYEIIRVGRVADERLRQPVIAAAGRGRGAAAGRGRGSHFTGHRRDDGGIGRVDVPGGQRGARAAQVVAGRGGLRQQQRVGGRAAQQRGLVVVNRGLDHRCDLHALGGVDHGGHFGRAQEAVAVGVGQHQVSGGEVGHLRVGQFGGGQLAVAARLADGVRLGAQSRRQQDGILGGAQRQLGRIDHARGHGQGVGAIGIRVGRAHGGASGVLHCHAIGEKADLGAGNRAVHDGAADFQRGGSGVFAAAAAAAGDQSCDCRCSQYEFKSFKHDYFFSDM